MKKDAGGLGLLNCLWYYWAANLVAFTHKRVSKVQTGSTGKDPTLDQHSRHGDHTIVIHSSQTRLLEPHLGYGCR